MTSGQKTALLALGVSAVAFVGTVAVTRRAIVKKCRRTIDAELAKVPFVSRRLRLRAQEICEP